VVITPSKLAPEFIICRNSTSGRERKIFKQAKDSYGLFPRINISGTQSFTFTIPGNLYEVFTFTEILLIDSISLRELDVSASNNHQEVVIFCRLLSFLHSMG
jgi:hypothetical protein